MKLVIRNSNKNKFQVPILKQADQLESENLEFLFFNQLIHWNLKFKILEFAIVFCLLCCCFAGCDTIYTNKSNPLALTADSSVSKCLRVEGVLAVFPSLRKVSINRKSNKLLKEKILVLIFHDKKEVLDFKRKTDRDSNKSISNIKQKIDTQKDDYAVVQVNNTVPYVLSLSNTTVFKEGLWIVFYSETSQDIQTFLEFKRMGINEIPKTSIIPI
ncbi:hypothetical protein [Flavobacterium sp. ENC]|uniref:hypothetical protein n=1 Tax=Flavobacterium sp. ENC TaxID=2897330 RepID=UPI001E4F1D27|nr:hypothetical protein [Flavobacterium sp. ENC]MCD0467627.1 hypothetical protein [Flavobacterium sp. ENC]